VTSHLYLSREAAVKVSKYWLAGESILDNWLYTVWSTAALQC